MQVFQTSNCDSARLLGGLACFWLCGPAVGQRADMGQVGHEEFERGGETPFVQLVVGKACECRGGG